MDRLELGNSFFKIAIEDYKSGNYGRALKLLKKAEEYGVEEARNILSHKKSIDYIINSYMCNAIDFYSVGKTI